MTKMTQCFNALFFVMMCAEGCELRITLFVMVNLDQCAACLLGSSFSVSHKVGNVVNFVLGIVIKGIWTNSINLVLQLK